jgi:hypothetical protein
MTFYQYSGFRMFLGLPDPHLDPLDRGTDPRIRIRIRAKMSQNHNTGVYTVHCRYWVPYYFPNVLYLLQQIKYAHVFCEMSISFRIIKFLFDGKHDSVAASLHPKSGQSNFIVFFNFTCSYSIGHDTSVSDPYSFDTDPEF